MTVQGPVKEQQPDGMSHGGARRGEAPGAWRPDGREGGWGWGCQNGCCRLGVGLVWSRSMASCLCGLCARSSAGRRSCRPVAPFACHDVVDVWVPPQTVAYVLVVLWVSLYAASVVGLSRGKRTGAAGGRGRGEREQRCCGQGCVRKAGASGAAPEAVRQAVGGGCQSGCGRLLSVTNAMEAGTWRQGDSGWA